VGGIGVSVGGTGVGGIGVAVGAAAGAPQAASSKAISRMAQTGIQIDLARVLSFNMFASS